MVKNVESFRRIIDLLYYLLFSLPSGGICDDLKKNNQEILGIETVKQGS
jgi:hypothetical protein